MLVNKEDILPEVTALIAKMYPSYLEDPNLAETPARIAKMYCEELFAGSFTEPPKLTVFPNTKKYNQLIIVPDINFSSVCSHHWLSFMGFATIGILLNEDSSFLGLSKYARLVDWFARRPQVQENLTEEIADYINETLKPAALGVYISANHLCAVVRGIKQPTSTMITTALRGEMLTSPYLKSEFLARCK
jgi:GTP cyclohydrolase I